MPYCIKGFLEVNKASVQFTSGNLVDVFVNQSSQSKDVI